MNTLSSRILLAGLCVAAIAMSTVATLKATSMESQFAAPTPVAVVDWLAVTERLDEWKAKQVDLSSHKSALEDRMTGIGTEMDQIREDIEVLPPDRQREQLRRYRELAFQLEGFRQFAEQDLATEKTTEQLRIYQKINDAVARVAQRDGWQVVVWDDSKSKRINLERLDESVELISRRQVFYTAATAVDITDEVVNLMNNDWAAGGSGG